MKDHCCANCDHCRKKYKGYKYYCLRWEWETYPNDICYEFYYEE